MSGDMTGVHRATGVSEMALTFSVIFTDQAIESSRFPGPSRSERVKRYVMVGIPLDTSAGGAGAALIQRHACYSRASPALGSPWEAAMELRGAGTDPGPHGRATDPDPQARAQRALLSRLAVGAGAAVGSDVLEDDLGLTPSALRTSISRLRAVIGASHLVTATTGYQLRPTCLDAAKFEDDLARAGGAGAQGRARRSSAPWAAGEAVPSPTSPMSRGRSSRSPGSTSCGLEPSSGWWSCSSTPAKLPWPWPPSSPTWPRTPSATGPRSCTCAPWSKGPPSRGPPRLPGPPSHPPRGDRHRAVAGAGGARPVHRPRPTDRLVSPRGHRARPRPPTGARPAHRAQLLRGPARGAGGRSALARAHRLVTLTGAGGCGKTRLALELAAGSAATHPGGAWWVELSHVHDDAHLADQLALAAGLAPGSEGGVVAALGERIGGAGPALLVIDNAAHLVGHVAELVEVLATGCPDVHVLVTGREPLGLAGELIWRVPSLSAAGPAAQRGDVEAADSARLFLERAHAARPGLVVGDADVAHVVAICDGLDGLPLALELAAAQTRTLPLERVASGVDDAVRWLSRATHSPLSRHQTLHASIAWSVDLVGPAEQAVLTRLTVFRGWFTLEAAEAVGAGDDLEPAEVVACLSRLVDSSLLQLEPTAHRYRLLSTVRQFCLQREARDRRAGPGAGGPLGVPGRLLHEGRRRPTRDRAGPVPPRDARRGGDH